eukprot:355925-Chlamydomonas_euryale.AAC.6
MSAKQRVQNNGCKKRNQTVSAAHAWADRKRAGCAAHTPDVQKPARKGKCGRGGLRLTWCRYSTLPLRSWSISRNASLKPCRTHEWEALCGRCGAECEALRGGGGWCAMWQFEQHVAEACGTQVFKAWQGMTALARPTSRCLSTSQLAAQPGRTAAAALASLEVTVIEHVHGGRSRAKTSGAPATSDQVQDVESGSGSLGPMQPFPVSCKAQAAFSCLAVADGMYN